MGSVPVGDVIQRSGSFRPPGQVLVGWWRAISPHSSIRWITRSYSPFGAENIHDQRFLRLVRHLLESGYLEEWRYNTRLRGCPQGGVISPILSNIYLDKLDQYVEHVLIPMYTSKNSGE
jgi:hypothetical protein